MRPFVVVVAVLLGMAAGLNGFTAWDRARHEARIEQAAAAFRPGLALLDYRDTDERRFQKARLAVIPRPRVVAFGSSRVMTVSTAMVDATPGEFYNIGLSGGTVEDFIVLWTALRDAGKVPRVALFAIDNYEFNASQSQIRWLAWADEVARFVDTAGVAGWPRRARLERLLYRWYQAKELVSYAVLETSLRELNRLAAGRQRRGAELLDALGGRLVPEAQTAGQRALRADGSLVYEREYAGRPAALVDADALDFAVRTKAGLGAFTWDAERARRLELLWRDMRAHGVAIVAYLPPYHPIVWDAVRRDSDLALGLATTTTFLERLGRAVGARVLDYSDPAAIPCAAGDFLDGRHVRSDCQRRLLARVLAAR